MKNKPRKLSIESTKQKRLRRESFEEFMVNNTKPFMPIQIPIQNTCTALFSTYTETTSTSPKKPLNFWQKIRVKITKFLFS